MLYICAHRDPTDLEKGRPLFFNLSAIAIKFNKICSVLCPRFFSHPGYLFYINLVHLFYQFDNSTVFLWFVKDLVFCTHALCFFSNTMEKNRNINWKSLVHILTA